MPTADETVRPNNLQQVQASIEGWFEGVLKGLELPIRFSHSKEFPNRLTNLEKELPKERINEAVAAPTDYLVFLNALSASSLASESAAEDPLAAAKFRGLERKRQLVEAAGGALSAQDVAELLGITRQAVDKRRTQNQLIALTQGKRGYIYPSFQFEDGNTISGLGDVLEQLKSFDPWMQLAFFVNANDRLNGKTPVAALRASKQSDVLRAARSYGEQGAS